VRKALAGRNLWLLVVNTRGINVWCAAAGGIFTHNRVIDAIKITSLNKKVEHQEVILPALAAPGIDRKAIEAETGFRARFGPVYAGDIPAYLQAGKKKTDEMRRFRFDLKHRLSMLLPMNFPVYLLLALVLTVFWRQYLLGFTVLFWLATAMLYMGTNIIPGKSGWAQALLAASVVTVLWAAIDSIVAGKAFEHRGWWLATFAIFLAAGFDLAGITSARKSDAEQLMSRLGFKKFGTFFHQRGTGQISLDRSRCIGCGNCFDICPVGVYKGIDQDKKAGFRDLNACFTCSACVRQCPVGALSLY
ncbi:MAG: 4Fe-4S dicluster domain-containing protein, partial [Actinobacteria bacterium]|nr:4Fe-4S dicluster domain-containing protein [Actinomycetota bacterium]